MNAFEPVPSRDEFAALRDKAALFDLLVAADLVDEQTLAEARAILAQCVKHDHLSADAR